MKIRRKIIIFLSLVFCFNNAFSATVLGTGSDAELVPFLSAQVELLAKISAEEQFGNSTLVTEWIPRVQQGIDIANATFEGIRVANKLQQAVRSYDKDDLMKDMKAGFCKMLKNGSCERMEESFNELRDNYQMTKQGDSQRFWNYRSSLRTETRQFMKHMVEGMSKAYLYPKIAPNVSSYYGYDQEPNEIDEIYQVALARSGMDKKVYFEQIQSSMINMELARFLDDAEQSKNISARGLAIQAAISKEMSRDINIMKNIEQSQFLNDELDMKNKFTESEVFKAAYLKELKKLKDQGYYKKAFKSNVSK